MSEQYGPRVLVVGNPDRIHVGAHLVAGARTLGCAVQLCDTSHAFAAPWPVARLNWWLRGHYPSRLRAFSAEVLELCRSWRPAVLLATGLAPLQRETLAAIGKLGVVRLNYLTDDPWNPALRAPWFLRGLAEYDLVCSPRRANLPDLERAGCRQVAYLPFAYNPATHFAEPPATPFEHKRFDCDLLFAGGADSDRLPVALALIRAGFKLALYGGYWDRHPVTQPFAHGHADPATMRKAAGGARVALCLVRRANRDGHVMRSYELPAMGACMLTEDTPEHRELFGAEGEATLYFCTTEMLLEKLRWLLANPAERTRLASAAHSRIVAGANTYADRLRAVLELTGLAIHSPQRAEATP